MVNRLIVEECSRRYLRVYDPGIGRLLVAIPVTGPSDDTWADPRSGAFKVVHSTDDLLRPISFSTGIAIAAGDFAHSEAALPSVLVAQRTVAVVRTRMNWTQ